MNELVELWEKPQAEEIYMIAGWEQWADAGNVSSGLPGYLIHHTDARKIGSMNPDGYYLFQVPGTHDFLRPEVSLEEGYRKTMSRRENNFYYSGDERKGLVIFLGDEPHMNAERYAAAFFDTVQSLGVKRVVALGGVYGSMPYRLERDVSCAYSIWGMKEELERYAVRFSDYQGGATISTYLADLAEERSIEFVSFYAFVPAYDFSELSNMVQGVRIENDFKAWYELMRRVNHMFDLGLDLSELEKQSDELVDSMDAKINELDRQIPQIKIKEYIEKLTGEFNEMSFLPLDDVWERALDDLFEDIQD